MEYLKVENLSKQYGDFIALNKVSFSLEKGKILGLLGPNGAGKTSLIRIITRIIQSDNGNVYFNGNKINDSDIANIGYLPEERGLYPQLTVNNHLIFLAQLKGLSASVALKEAAFWMKKLGVEPFQHKKIAELSKGMAQKVQFIATLIHNPSLLILDEPFSGFDPVNANQVKNAILELKAQGKTIVLSTHNMNSVEEICDDLVLLHKSNLLLSGTVLEIKNKYASHLLEVKYRGTSIAFSNALWTSYKIIETSTKPDGSTVAQITATNKVDTNQLLSALISAVEIISVKPILPSLTDIFISLVGNEDLLLNTSLNLTE